MMKIIELVAKSEAKVKELMMMEIPVTHSPPVTPD